MTSTTPPPEGEEVTAPDRQEFLRPYDTFVAAVRAACADPGTQQALRRGLGKAVEEVPARTHAKLLRPGLVPDHARGDARRAHYAVAALIAARPRAQRDPDGEPPPAAASDTTTTPNADNSPPPTSQARDTASFGPWGTSLGESLALAVARRDGEPLKEDGVEARLHLMVRQDVDGIHRMLPGVLRQLGTVGVPVDYACLLSDLSGWRYRRDAIAARWLEHYYRTLRRQRAAAAARNGPAANEPQGTAAPAT
ncbi:type I-E CRISPR-associated protein Cse2/CasB [Streptomyces sp. CMB-StM0423]|uniref:type I-E CRISPR-associated protein Cse2/CasB n=1 Tax=Streptomyces sp. CMB-StM0423 TaxID=2059884 RepID=UPI000C708136|nr:type I-E CRISPR-associated protein Cse2/CasB [Streptomyces sp. CMB-StM0423]AUH40558.1 type I-E CRISPR-associated protein Cse2/CasB [Streptomyces sp. CMB-StM0423]